MSEKNVTLEIAIPIDTEDCFTNLEIVEAAAKKAVGKDFDFSGIGMGYRDIGWDSLSKVHAETAYTNLLKELPDDVASQLSVVIRETSDKSLDEHKAEAALAEAKAKAMLDTIDDKFKLTE